MAKKNILVVGSGGREHALCWKFAQSPRVDKVYCAPGNAGISKDAICVPIKASDLEGLAKFAKENSIDITIVGPEAPLADGIVDFFEEQGLVCFGPDKKAAQIEASKVFTKDLLWKYGIPTGKYKVFEDAKEAFSFVKEETGVPIVVKADGLAAGKGVILCYSLDEAKEAINKILVDKVFGDSGNRVVIEEFLEGEEASFMAITDGKNVLPLATSQDHKPIYDGDKGPNTGGMGAYSPAPVVTSRLFDEIMDEIIRPTIEAMAKEGCPYKGVLYAGLIIKKGKAKVLEYNCRFGDPEAQPILMRLKTDLLDIVEAAIEGRLDEMELSWDERAALCVVLASKGYPGSYEKGKKISGLDEVEKMNDVVVFHAGTAKDNGNYITAGGRVLGVTALGNDIKAAIDKAYEAVEKISWDGMYYRTDIGKKALKHLGIGTDVAIIMGSKSDLKVMEKAADVLDDFGVSFQIKVLSAHRSPELTAQFSKEARDKGIKVIIAGAGMAAHLAGAIAANTTLPVIGVPIDSSSLNGLDALLSTVQMPPGIPVASMGIGKAGAKNAALFAIEILSITNPELKEKLANYRKKQEENIIKINENGL